MAIKLRRTWTVEGVLTNATSVTLSNAAGTIGVVRNDTGASVVAPGTAMPLISTGTYEYTFTEPAPELTYTAWIKIVYAGNTHYFEVDLVGAPVPGTPQPLTCNYASLVNEVARQFFGLVPTSSDVISDHVASTQQAADILRAIAKGLQYVYSAYRWSFLRPVVPLTTTANVSYCALPAGVDSLEGRPTFPSTSSAPRVFLERLSEVGIRQMLARNSTPGRPRFYAETTAPFDPTTGSTRTITFFPVPDAAYTLSAIGTIRPTMIDAVNQYPLGIEVLAPCITEACLAAAERDIDEKDAADPNAVHNRALVPLLEMAIQRDKDYSSPDTLGFDDGEEDDRQCGHPRRTGGIYWNAGGGIVGYI